MKCLYAQQMRAADQAAMDLGIPPIVLMENAGRSVYEQIHARWHKLASQRVIIIAGKGNNGGDGFVVARHLWNAGYDVRVYVLGRTSEIKGHARANLDIIINMGLPISLIIEDNDVEMLRTELLSRRANLLVDAIFGTGLSKEVSGVHRRVIECVNDSEIPVVAVDIPSGLNADTGFPLGIAVRATLTVSFAYPKVGLVIASGTRYAGELAVTDISIPASVGEPTWQVSLLDESILSNIPVRAQEAHKGDFGRVCLFAGSAGLTGAATLTSAAVLRTGAGLVTLGIPRALNDIMEIKLTEVMTRPLGTPEATRFSPDMLDEALDLSTRADAAIIGPGIGTHEQTAEFVDALLPRLSCPLVLDADALNIIARSDYRLNVPAVLTPHPGEMSRLLQRSAAQIQEDRIDAARCCAERYQAVTVLKGFRTIIASPEGQVAINPTGSSAMATGGMGDLLPGIIGTFLAQGLSPFEAACLGTYLHGLASDRLTQHALRGQIASDLLSQIPLLLKEYSEV